MFVFSVLVSPFVRLEGSEITMFTLGGRYLNGTFLGGGCYEENACRAEPSAQLYGAVVSAVHICLHILREYLGLTPVYVLRSKC